MLTRQSWGKQTILCMSVMAAAMVSALHQARAAEVIIGTGTSTWNYPLASLYHDARTQTIYLASEIGAVYSINGLALYVTQTPGQTLNNFTIRMKHTGLSVYSGSPQWESAGWTVAYRASRSISTTGWVQFNFATPFSYDGAQNLLVDISFNNNSYTSDGLCRYSMPGGTRSIYYRTDSGYGDPLTWSGQTPSPSSASNVPNIKLIVQSPTVLQPAFSPDGGAYDSDQQVTITCATPDAVIHYTTTGLDPTEGDAVVASGGSVTISVVPPTTLKAKAFKTGWSPSGVKSATYSALPIATPAFSPDGGMYDSDRQVTITCATPDAVIHYTTNGLDPTESDAVVASGNSVTIGVFPPTTLKAKAFKAGWPPSGVKVGVYRRPQPVFVSISGNDTNDGLSWATAKRTVQSAQNAAAAVDRVVWVAVGTYPRVDLQLGIALYGGFGGTEDPETFHLADRDFVLNETILDGNQSGSVVTAPPGATETTRIDGFTIRNGSGTDAGARYGGGIYCNSSSPTIANNTITTNSAFRGGGICCFSSSPMITQNTICGNIASDHGGIYCDSSSPMIANNTISGNTASDYGGGISCFGGSPTIGYNTITGNSAGYGAGGIYSWSSSPAIVNNTIKGNSAAYSGGGIYCSEGTSVKIANNMITDNSGGGIYIVASSPTIVNNTISGNTASEDYGGGISCSGGSPTIANNAITGNGGGGIWCGYSSSPTIANNTITGNTVPYYRGGGGVCCSSSFPSIVNTIIAFNSSGILITGTSTPTLRYNCVYANWSYNYLGITDPTGTNGSISADPQIAGYQYGGRWHLRPTSPCVNTGGNASVPPDIGDLDSDGNTTEPLPFDLDGQLRIQPQGGTVDIGADESDGTEPPDTGPNVVVRVSPDGDDAKDGSSWALAKRTVQAGINAATVLGGEVWVKAGIYPERIMLRAHTHVYGGFGAAELSRDQRDFQANVTILDGQQGGSVVTMEGLGYGFSTIDGFTIRNGSGTLSGPYTYGGGVYCADSSATIANNTITGNSAYSGGGIYCGGYLFSTIANNVITGNNATGTNWTSGGGGIYCRSSSPTIANNTITRNSAGYNSGHGGGGIWCSDASSPTIANNMISGNTADDGGGISCLSSSPTIANNTITGNSASYGIGGIDCIFSSPTIANNMITDNRGGGIYCYSSSPMIANNTITRNTADYGGGGIYCSEASSPTIANTIIAFNSSGIYIAGTSTPTLRYNCVYGNMESNYSGITDPTGTGGNISSDPLLVQLASPGPDGIWGTVDDDYGDLRLQFGSPCTDAGSNADVPADAADLDGDGNITEPMPFDLAGMPRFADDPATADTGVGTPPIVNMGAYENRSLVATPAFSPDGGGYDSAQQVGITCATPGAIIHYTTTGLDPMESDPTIASGGSILVTVAPPTTLKARAFRTDAMPSNVKTAVYHESHPIFVSTGGSDTNDGLSWATAKRTVQAGLSVATAGDEVWVATGTYVERIMLQVGVGLYGGFAGVETNRSQRNWTANPTILDGNQGASVVTSPPAATTSTRIDGFTIRNGSGTLWDSIPRGGGIYCSYSSPTIANNTITTNNASKGGGIYCSSSSPMIVNNTVTANGAYAGGGILCEFSSPTIANNLITANSGGAIYLVVSSPTIASNTITANNTSYSGGGIYCYSSSPTIVNTITSLNSSGIYSEGSGTLTLRYNCVYGNTAYNYSGFADPTGTNGSISEDPLFLDRVGGDYHLTSSSPCVDSGGNGDLPGGITADLDGNARIINCLVDMGAYEADYGLASPIPGDLDDDCDVDDGDLGTFETCGSGPAIPHSGTPVCQRADFDKDNDVDQADFAIFQRCYSGSGHAADPNCAN
jgi:parallel beta-helix repeat protein